MAQKKKQSEDLRVLRTRKAVMQAFIELTIEQGFSALTVQDIVDRAMVNRATFYRHYLDKYDLLDTYMTEVYELTDSQAEVALPSMQAADVGKPPVGMVKMLEHVQQHADFYRAMLGAKGDMAFVQKARYYIERRLRSFLPSNGLTQHLPQDLCIRYVAHAGVGAIAWWLEEGQSYSSEQVAAWLNQLNTTTLAYALGEARLAEL